MLSVKSVVQELVRAALAAADPAAAVRRALVREGTTLRVADRAFDLNDLDRIIVVGAGKAGAAMSSAAEAILGDLPQWQGGLVIVKDPPTGTQPATITLL